jgi:predicted transcriptional regulator
MKTSITLSIILLLCGIFILPEANAQQSVTPKVKVIYFHNTRRCETCLAIEEQAKLALEENYKIQLDKGEVAFAAYNFDDKANKKIIKELKVAGQALLVVKDGKQVDITDKGFLFARNDPEKFKKIICETIGKL